MMLNIQHLTIKKQNNDCLIDDFSFTLKEHDKIALIGEEGNGKSTLLKAIYHIDRIASYTSISGTIDMDAQRIGYLPQHLDEHWKDVACMEYLLKQSWDEEIAYEAYNDLALLQHLAPSLGIPANLIVSQQPMAVLSGGEKVKLQLLKLIKQECDLYLLDEPTNDLDIDTLQWLETFILQCAAPVLFVSHDEVLLSHCANRILHLEQRNKKTKAMIHDVRCDYDTYVKKRSAQREKEVQIARKEKQEYEQKKERLNNIMNAVHDAQNSVSRQAPQTARLLKKKMHAVKAMDRRMEREGYHKVDSLEEGIAVYFEDVQGIGDKVILRGDFDVRIADRTLIQPFFLDVRGRDKLAIIGPNGTGKTQLIKRLYATLAPRTDIVLGYMPQQYSDLMKAEEIAFHFLLETGDQADITASRELLGRMKFTQEEMLTPIKSLSEGQKAKLYLARFIKHKCNVLLLDEPTRNLSPLSAPLIRSLLRDYKGCIIAVTHDRLLLKEVFSKVLSIESRTAILSMDITL